MSVVDSKLYPVPAHETNTCSSVSPPMSVVCSKIVLIFEGIEDMFGTDVLQASHPALPAEWPDARTLETETAMSRRQR
jgi:hypothetical protein